MAMEIKIKLLWDFFLFLLYIFFQLCWPCPCCCCWLPILLVFSSLLQNKFIYFSFSHSSPIPRASLVCMIMLREESWDADQKTLVDVVFLRSKKKTISDSSFIVQHSLSFDDFPVFFFFFFCRLLASTGIDFFSSLYYNISSNSSSQTRVEMKFVCCEQKKCFYDLHREISEYIFMLNDILSEHLRRVTSSREESRNS